MLMGFDSCRITRCDLNQVYSILVRWFYRPQTQCVTVNSFRLWAWVLAIVSQPCATSSTPPLDRMYYVIQKVVMIFTKWRGYRNVVLFILQAYAVKCIFNLLSVTQCTTDKCRILTVVYATFVWVNIFTCIFLFFSYLGGLTKHFCYVIPMAYV